MIAKMRDFSFTQLFIFFLGSLMCVSCVSGSNVCIDKISYGVDDFGKKYVNIVVNNYGDEGTEEKGFLHVFIKQNRLFFIMTLVNVIFMLPWMLKITHALKKKKQ